MDASVTAAAVIFIRNIPVTIIHFLLGVDEAW